MNNRDYKKFVSGNYYHIYNRGNNRMDIYKDEQDYFNFLKRVKLTLGLDPNLQKAFSQTLRISPLPENSFSIVCYCLMPNHFHFLVKQNSSISISVLLSKVCTSYSKYFNKKYKHIGHLFQDQFKAIHVEGNEYLIWLSAYIHQNPKVAGIVDDLVKHKWSSYPELIMLNNNSERLICDKDIILSQFNSTEDYKSYVDKSYGPIKNGKIIDKFDIILD